MQNAIQDRIDDFFELLDCWQFASELFERMQIPSEPHWRSRIGMIYDMAAVRESRDTLQWALDFDEILRVEPNCGAAETLSHLLDLTNKTLPLLTTIGWQFAPLCNTSSAPFELISSYATFLRTFDTRLIPKVRKLIDVVALQSVESKPDQEVPTSPHDPDRKLKIHDQMTLRLLQSPEAVAWSVNKWAEALGCTKAAIHSTPAWKTIMSVRSQERFSREDEQAARSMPNEDLGAD